MKKKFYLLLVLCCVLTGTLVAQTTIYVSPTGVASNPGTQASPTTLAQAIATVPAGGTILMRGGTYSISTTIVIARGNDGTSGATKKLWAFTGETPVLNFSAMSESTSNRGIVLDALYWHLRGLTIQQAGDNGILLSGNNNTIESCIFKGNRDTGLQLSRYQTSFNSISQWPSNNLIVNCEAFDNRDAGNENADGFAAKLTSGTGNVFRGCVSHHNIDDGWDLYTKTDTGPIGAITLENCIAHDNGILTTGGTSGSGDKNGFKLGGEDIAVNHIVRRCIAYNNGQHGFTYNRNLGSIEVTNNTSYNNAERNFNFDGGTSVFKNNLSFQSGSNDRIIGTASAPNSFTGAAGGFTITSADFATLTPGSNANPTSNGFLNLASGSDAIDGGVTTTGITFNGARPDLGAIEFGGTTPVSFTLTTTASPSSGGSITRSPNATSYTSGTVVTLTAVPASGYSFSGWSGAASGTSATVTVTMNANKTVTATFTQNPANTFTLTTTASPSNGGSITRSPNATSYTSGTVVTLTAVPAIGFTFSGWSGAASGTATSVTVTITANTSVTATFTQSSSTFTLTTTASPSNGGSITRSPNATSYASGTVVTLTAVPASGFTFSGWSGAVSGTSLTTTVTMSANRSVTAIFTQSTGTTTLRIEDSATPATGLCSYDGALKDYTNANNGKAINLSNSSAKGITWRVSVTAGTYQLRWRYVNGGSSAATTAALKVNGTTVSSSVSFPKTADKTNFVTSANTSVTLVGGANEIRLETTQSAEFADIDWIEILGTSVATASCSSGSRFSDGSEDTESTMNSALEGFNASAFPNPSNGTVTVGFTLMKEGAVSIRVIDPVGKQLAGATTKTYAKGYHEVKYNALKSGMHYFNVVSREGSRTLKLAVE